jgi:hypothetical protein
MQLSEIMRPTAAIRLAAGIAFGVLAGFVQSPETAAQEAADITVSHGLSSFGELKYPADFAHFDYVNPQAPKGGVLSHTGYASAETFDTFNPYIIKGTAPEGLALTSTDGGGSVTYDSLMVAAADEPSSVYTLALTKPPAETRPADPQIRVPAGPPPEVVFGAPTQDETDVLSDSNVRIQFSRDIDPATFRGRVRAQYIGEAAAAAGDSAAALELTTTYRAATRVLEIRFTQPLDRLRTVRIDLLDGVLGTDQQPLAPWTLTFLTGGS